MRSECVTKLSPVVHELDVIRVVPKLSVEVHVVTGKGSAAPDVEIGWGATTDEDVDEHIEVVDGHIVTITDDCKASVAVPLPPRLGNMDGESSTVLEMLEGSEVEGKIPETVDGVLAGVTDTVEGKLVDKPALTTTVTSVVKSTIVE